MIEKKMTNCPKCQKPILNEGLFTSAATFNIRCPWCQATLQVNVQPKIVTEVVKLANGNNYQPKEAAAQEPEELFTAPKNAQGFRLIGYLYPEKKE